MPLVPEEASSSFEQTVQRNPHPDFHKVQASRPDFNNGSVFRFTKAPKPDWEFGSGANGSDPVMISAAAAAASATANNTKNGHEDHHQQEKDGPSSKPAGQHVCIDPFASGRPAALNYKLLISAVIPRPIAFLSTLPSSPSSSSPSSSAVGSGGGGGGVPNLAPFSFFNMVCYDPPLFVVGFSGRPRRGKDTLANLRETGECVINIISEGFVEAANAAAVNAPPDASEWALAGLTPAADCVTVRCPRVAEAVFSIEARLESVREFASRERPGDKSGAMAVLEGTRFWVRADALADAGRLVDPAVLRPVSRLGGISYGRTTEAYELLRPDFAKDVGGSEGWKSMEAKRGGVGGGEGALDG